MNSQKIRLQFSHSERVANITLAAPKANIVDRAMIAELDAAFSRCAGHHLNAIVLGAEGPHFSFGASVQEHLPEHICGYACRVARALAKHRGRACAGDRGRPRSVPGRRI